MPYIHVENRYSLPGEENLVHLAIHQEELVYNPFICIATSVHFRLYQAEHTSTSHDQIYFAVLYFYWLNNWAKERVQFALDYKYM